MRSGKYVGIVIVIATASALAAPQLVCEKPEYSFGVRREHETVVHRFVLKNAGDAPLAITRVKASCGCTAVNSSTNSIAAGEEAFVEARFKLKGRRGKQNKSIMVESNDPATPRTRLWLKGEIVTEVAMEPRYMNFRQIHTNSVATQTVSLVSLRPDIRIAAVKGDGPFFKATIDPDGRGLTVRTVPPLKVGHTRARLTVTTDHPDGLTTDLNIIGMAVGDLTVVPRDVILRKSQPGPVRLALTVRPFGRIAFKVLNVDFPLVDITPVISPQTNGSVHVVMHGLRPDPALAGKFVVIHTDLKSTREIRVPIRILP